MRQHDIPAGQLLLDQVLDFLLTAPDEEFKRYLADAGHQPADCAGLAGGGGRAEVNGTGVQTCLPVAERTAIRRSSTFAVSLKGHIMATHPEFVPLPVELNEELSNALAASCGTLEGQCGPGLWGTLLQAHGQEKAWTIFTASFKGLVDAARRQEKANGGPLDRTLSLWGFERVQPRPFVLPVTLASFLTSEGKLSPALEDWLLESDAEDLQAHAEQGWSQVKSRSAREEGCEFPVAQALAFIDNLPLRWALVYCASYGLELYRKECDDGGIQWVWCHRAQGVLGLPVDEPEDAALDAQKKLGLPA